MGMGKLEILEEICKDLNENDLDFDIIESFRMNKRFFPKKIYSLDKKINASESEHANKYSMITIKYDGDKNLLIDKDGINENNNDENLKITQKKIKDIYELQGDIFSRRYKYFFKSTSNIILNSYFTNV